ncbi:MAG: hypothetical protein ACEQSX_18050 [Baekduiaceae bacterium]
MSEIEDRRQRAREAAHDAWNNTVSPRQAVELAIETATRVQITPEAIEAFDVERNGSTDAGNIPAGLAAALAALGFEVEQ